MLRWPDVQLTSARGPCLVLDLSRLNQTGYTGRGDRRRMAAWARHASDDGAHDPRTVNRPHLARVDRPRRICAEYVDMVLGHGQDQSVGVFDTIALHSDHPFDQQMTAGGRQIEGDYPSPLNESSSGGRSSENRQIPITEVGIHGMAHDTHKLKVAKAGWQ